jgi:uncharacterized protein (DUF305 family)
VPVCPADGRVSRAVRPRNALIDNSQENSVNRKTLALAALPVAAVLTLAGCGNSDNGSASPASGHSSMAGMPGMSSSASAHTKQDIAFAQGMIPHHQQAIAMAKLAAANAGSAQVRHLAARIEAAQGPEIKTMTGWLKSWGASTSMSGMSGMDMGRMPGMMSEGAMKKLAHADGKDFDTMFLRGMITHHQGALTMAEQEIAKGKNPDAIALAKSIKASQAKEIVLMRTMLAS